MYKMTADQTAKEGATPSRRRQQQLRASLPNEVSEEQLMVPDAGSEGKPTRRVYKPSSTTRGQPEEVPTEARTAPTVASSSLGSKHKPGSKPSSSAAASHPSLGTSDEDDGLLPPPGAYRVGLGDESRISQVGLLMPAPAVAPDSMRMVNAATGGHRPGGSIAQNTEVSSLTSPSAHTDPTQPSIHAELVQASAVVDTAAVLATPGEVREYDSTTAGGGNTADEKISRDVDELKKQVNHNAFQNRVLLIVLIVIVLIGIAVGVTVALLLTGGDDGDNPTPAPTNGFELVITPSPVVATPAPTPSDALTIDDVVVEIKNLSPTTNFDDVGSPERQARDWLGGDAFSQGLINQGDVAKVLQRFGLAVLYYATNGQNWKSNTNWLSATDECIGWFGVICSNGRVTQFNHQSNRLQGTIPVESLIFIKETVTVFNLARNELDEEIPTEIGEMRQLTDLRLFENDFVGTIPPEVANLSLLRHLAFTLNKLTGTVPPIPALSQLTFLDIRDNEQLRGPLPDGFAGLDSLKQVYLFGTELTGTLSTDLCDTLETAWIDCGHIECGCCTANNDVPCPSEPSFAPSATPTARGATPKPTGFPTRAPTPPPAVFATSPPTHPTATNPPTAKPTHPTATDPPTAKPTQATLPPSPFPSVGVAPTNSPTPAPTPPTRSFRDVILQASSASSIDNAGTPAGKAFNWLEGDSFSQTQLNSNNDVSVVQRFAMATLFYAMNGESGWQNRGWLNDSNECDVSDLQCNVSGQISSINLRSVGGVAGSLPDEIGLLTGLTVFDIARNDVSGRIPTHVGRLTRMQELELFENNFNGPLPDQLSSLVELRRLAVTLNSLDGKIPSIFDGMTKLTFLDLRDNNFAGELPSGSMANMDSLKEIYLFNTDVSGTVPTDLCDTLENAWIDCGELVCDCCTARAGEPC